MYQTTQELFEARAPELVSRLDDSGKFWPEVKANTITNARLVQGMRGGEITGRTFGSDVWTACYVLSQARLLGEIANPG